METMYIVWSVAIILFVVIEAMTAQLISIWLVVGAVAGLIGAICNVSIPIQIVIFIAVTIIALIVTRPLVKKFVTNKVVKTNFDRCLGTDAIVLEDIDNINNTGAVKSDGKVWTARSTNGIVIPKDSIVKIDKIDGVKLMVTPK